jgi:RNA polymerase sigma-70 factor, ECF subfamily
MADNQQVPGVSIQHEGDTESMIALEDCEKAQSMPGVPADDDTLLAAVASRADHEAFSALYDRYSNSVYNLALYLTGSVLLAEEVVQEAMLRIWTSARTYTPKNARGWILCIATRESLHKLKMQKKRTATVGFDEAIDHHSGRSAQADELGSDEILQALRAELTLLSSDEQRLVALHFGGGLSLRRMSAELAVPRQTLHHQVTRLLNSLRRKLTTAGFA